MYEQTTQSPRETNDTSRVDAHAGFTTREPFVAPILEELGDLSDLTQIGGSL
jgi:hypothetical protein